MNRRSFIGRTLGVMVASQLPFIGESIKISPKMISPIDIFKMSDAELMKLITAIRLVSGQIIKGPGIKELIKIDNGITFKQKEIEATTEFEPISTILLTSNHNKIVESNLIVGKLYTGDHLKIDHTIKYGLRGE